MTSASGSARSSAAGPAVKRERTAGLPTIPQLPGMKGDRLALLGAIAFLEGAHLGWGARQLREWFRDYPVRLAAMTTPASITEPQAGQVSIAMASGGEQELQRLLAVARDRVVATLRGFIALTEDDRFLQAAIFAERVKRARREGAATWTAQLKATDALSDIVLALFAIDILMFRDSYRSLAVCEVCGRTSFARDAVGRTGCHEHVQRADGRSGFQTKKR